VYRTGQRFGAAHVVDVLVGKSTDKVLQYRHNDLSVFGIGEEHSAQKWRSVIRQLIVLGFLRADAERYGALVLTANSRAVLRGETSVSLREDATQSRARRPRASQQDEIGAGDQDLWSALRACRRELAEEQGVPPFVIFHDKTLREMLLRRPRDAAELLSINGVGHAKLERYGQRFLEVLAEG
jgi:ATP-dependent DNA helicase RecQ